MRRLKPAPDPWIDLDAGDRRRRPSRGDHGRWLDAPPPRRDALDLVFGTIWLILTLPFRLVFGVFGLIGRLTGLVVGFSMMVLGAALLAGPLAIVGIPLFIVGLFMAMRAL